ncbi:MAG: hypothetical protein ACRCX2_37805 [Paraclostridium sp.]
MKRNIECDLPVNFENYMALFTCIVQDNISISKALSLQGIMPRGVAKGLKRKTRGNNKNEDRELQL